MKIGNRAVRYRILMISFVLLIIIMFFTGFVNYMTFVSHYNNALVAAYSVPAHEIVRKIEYAVNYGKPIENFYGMQDTLGQLKDIIPELEQVNIVSPQGNILYDFNGFVKDNSLPDELWQEIKFRQDFRKDNSNPLFYQENAYLFSAISSTSQSSSIHNKSTEIANLVMIFPESTFLQFNSELTRQLAVWLIGIVIIAMVLMFLLFFRTRLLENNSFNNKIILMILIVVLGGAQLCYTGVNYFLFRDAYTEMVYTSRDFIQSIASKNIAEVYEKGLTLDNITGLDEYFSSINEELPQIASIGIPSSARDSQISAEEVQVVVASDYVQEQVFKVLLDMLTVLVISVFFMVELSLLALSFTAVESHILDGLKNLDYKFGHSQIRALIFLVNLCAYMSATFVPIVMQNLYEPIMGLTKEVVLGLPLSAEMMGGILAIFLASWLMSRHGWRFIFYIGIIFLAAGNILSGFGVNGLLFVISRGVAGLGLGHILMAIRGLAVSLPEPSVAIASFSAGSIAGISCSLVIGGLLADRIGYEAVFCFAAVLAVIPLIYVRLFMKGLKIREKPKKSSSFRVNFIGIFTTKKTVVFLVCIFIPYFISGAFLDYYFPLFASAHGLSQSDISRGFLLNGLFIIYLGPVLTGYVTKKFSGIQGMIISMVIVVLALITFFIFGNIAGALVAIALLGFAESFGVSLKTTYFLNLPVIKDLEINKGIAYFSGMVNASRIAGPILYGLALSMGMRMGIGMIIVGLMTLLLIFCFFRKFEPEYRESGGMKI